MTDVRNQRLAAVSTVDANGVVAFSVPDATVILLKAIEITNVAATAGDAYALIQGGGQAVYTPWVNVAANRGAHQDVWIAMNPGDAMIVASTVWPMRFWLSGAVLNGPPPYPQLPAVVQLPLPYPWLDLDHMGQLEPMEPHSLKEGLTPTRGRVRPGRR